MQRIMITLIFFILIPALSASAEPRYVTDQILIGLRPAQNDTSPPLEYLATGTRIEVIEDLGPFLKIKSPTGAIGFARSKYFLLTPPAGTSAATVVLQEQLTTALKRNIELTTELQRLQALPTTGANSTQSVELAKSQKDLADFSKRYQELEESRGETAVIIQERDELRQEVMRLKESSKDKAPSSLLSGGSQLQWFLAGAAILLAGWFAGKSTRSKRRF